MPEPTINTHRNILQNPTQLINRISRIFARVTESRLRRLGLAVAQVPVLVALKDGRQMQQSELARVARIEQPSMAQLLGRMERDELIRRLPDQRDQRIRWIELTPKALERLEEAHAVMMTSNDEALAGFTEQEIASLEGFLQRVSDNLDRTSEGLGL